MSNDKDAKLGHSGNFGERLKRLRKARKLSLVELGEKSGLSFSHLSRYERGVTKPSADGLQRLSDALQVSVAALMDDEAPIHMADPEIRQQLQEIELLPEEDRHVIKRMINAFLFQHRVKHLSTAI
jgi:transcriptional regulator with XRE-family HTH domain